MKNSLLILLVFTVILSCQKDDKNKFTPKNHLQEFQTESTQIFNLDTLATKEIIGKYGTKIYFSRDNFDVLKNQKITLELIELYDFKEIIYKNISTITTDNKLLETNGVLYVSFKSNGEKIYLKKNKNIFIYPPKGKLKNNDIFIAKKDSLSNIKWDITKQDYIVLTEDAGGGINIEHQIHKDSLNSFNKKREERADLVNDIIAISSDVSFMLTNNDFGYINIDRLVEIYSNINILVDEENVGFSGFNIYFTYNKLKSFIHNTRLKNELKFDSIPISGKTWMTVIGEKDSILYYDKIELKKELNNSEIILKMKKTTKENLNNILTN